MQSRRLFGVVLNFNSSKERSEKKAASSPDHLVFIIIITIVIFFFFSIRDGTVFENSLTSLTKEIVNALDSDVEESAIMLSESDMPTEAPPAPVPEVDIQKKPGRTFLHKLTGKFLAESGTGILHLSIAYLSLQHVQCTQAQDSFIRCPLPKSRGNPDQV